MGDYGLQNCGLVTHMRESAPKHPAQCDAWNASFSTGASDFPKPTKRFVKRLGWKSAASNKTGEEVLVLAYPCIRTHLEGTAKQRPKNFLDAVSISGPAIRRYSEGKKTGRHEGHYRRLHAAILGL